METEGNKTISEESKKQDKQDHFSDQEDQNDSFQVNVDFVKNRTTTSNFKFNIQITKEQNKSHENSRRNTRILKKDFLEKHPDEPSPQQNNQNTQNNPPKNEMSKNDNSTTIFENSSMMRKI